MIDLGGNRLNIEASLTKPVKQSELFESIVQVLGGGICKTELIDDLDEQDTSLQPLRILLVEDSYFNERFAIALLAKHGHDVEVASNGVEAIACYEGSEYDVILMDVQMPEMDGLEATRRIRELEVSSGNRTPIVAMTAHAMKTDRQKCLDAGMDDYVSKPIDAECLFAAIERVLGESSGIVLNFGAANEKTEPATEVSEVAQVERDPKHLSFNASAEAGVVVDAACSEEKPEVPKTADTESDAIVDFDEALTRVGGSVETLKTLALILVEECPKLLAEIQTAIVQRDAKTLCRASHTIKGSTHHFAADRVVRTAKRMEELGADADFESAQASLVELSSEVDSLCDRIKERFG